MSLAFHTRKSEILKTWDPSEIREYYNFYQEFPWGDMRADNRAGVIAAQVVNVNLKRDAKPKQPRDFMPYYQRLEGHKNKRRGITKDDFVKLLGHRVIKKHG